MHAAHHRFEGTPTACCTSFHMDGPLEGGRLAPQRPTGRARQARTGKKTRLAAHVNGKLPSLRGPHGVVASGVATVEKRVDRDYAGVILTVGQVLRVEDVAAQCLGRGENRAVPVRQLIALAELDTRLEYLTRDILHRKVADAVDELEGLLLGECYRAVRAGGLMVELLKYLHRQRQVFGLQQRASAATLGGILRQGTYGI